MRKSLLLAIALLAFTQAVFAQGYPNRPVRVIVPFGTGSAVDLSARVIAQQLSEQLGQPFIVENRTGASGTIANAQVAKSAPDGYTLMAMDTSTAIVPSLFQLPFDVARDFAPIAGIARAPMALVVNPSLGIQNLKDFVALARANPGKYNYSSAGPGTPIHLATELFKSAAKVDVTHIPYKGGSDMVAAVLGGQVQMLLTTITNVSAQVAGGKVVALAVTTDGRRSPVMPDVPSMREAGLPDATIYTWFGLAGPADMPRDVVARLNTEVAKALAVPAIRDRFVGQGAETMAGSAEDFAAHIRGELKRWSDVVKAAGIRRE